MVSRTIWVAAALVTAAVATTGCASGGNDVLRSQDANAVDLNIIDGKTARSEVERIYGPPNATSFANSQNDIWIYRWARSTAKAENFIPYVGAFVGGRDIQQKELVILFNEQNVVVRHSMRDSTNSIRRNLSASSSPTPSPAQISTSPAPQPASASSSAAPSASPSASTAPVVGGVALTKPATPSPTTPTSTMAPIDTGRWACGIHNFSGSSDRRYTINFVVAADRTITLVSYGNAPATIVKSSPLTFTAVNPRGSRLTTFTLKPDNSMVITGPKLSDPAASFYNEGTCTKV
jgi:outer membrane protein assembly factor BamE (lipoprotein component of BamABCDE complex)